MELDTATAFTPWASLLGGALIGLSAVMVMGLFGRIAGIAGITGGVLDTATGREGPGDTGWRVAFLVGLVAAPLVYTLVTGLEVAQVVPSSLPGMAIAGLVVGVGVSLGSGCTSGHGVCGLARLSPRSLAAVLTFMATAGVTVYALRHIL